MATFEEYLVGCCKCKWQIWDYSFEAAYMGGRRHREKRPAHNVRISGVEFLQWADDFDGSHKSAS
jgi:hypothetical protein